MLKKRAGIPKVVIELTTLILSNLPVKSILRFKSVSKEWYSLISSAYFINFHRNNNNNRYVITANLKENSNSSPYLELESRALDSKLTLTTKFFLPKLINNKNKNYSYDYVSVVGSCRGLVLLNLFDFRHEDTSEFVMWNPSTNNYMFLPPLVHPPNDPSAGFLCGFGYDKSTNDYKLVIFTTSFQLAENGRTVDSISNHQRVYSVNRNSWGVNSSFSMKNMLIHRNPAVVDDHILHWLSWDFRTMGDANGGKVEIRGFDICTEEWLNMELPFPSLVAGVRGEERQLGVLDNCLCVLSYGTEEAHMCVWLMKEYGVKESWTKLWSVSNWPEFSKPLHGLPIAYSDGQLLVEIGPVGSYLWYNLKDNTIRPAGDRGLMNVTLCDTSLVPLPRPSENGAAGSFKQEFAETVIDGSDLEGSTAIDLQEFLAREELLEEI